MVSETTANGSRERTQRTVALDQSALLEVLDALKGRGGRRPHPPGRPDDLPGLDRGRVHRGGRSRPESAHARAVGPAQRPPATAPGDHRWGSGAADPQARYAMCQMAPRSGVWASWGGSSARGGWADDRAGEDCMSWLWVWVAPRARTLMGWLRGHGLDSLHPRSGRSPRGRAPRLGRGRTSQLRRRLAGPSETDSLSWFSRLDHPPSPRPAPPKRWSDSGAADGWLRGRDRSRRRCASTQNRSGQPSCRWR